MNRQAELAAELAILLDGVRHARELSWGFVVACLLNAEKVARSALAEGVASLPVARVYELAGKVVRSRARDAGIFAELTQLRTSLLEEARR